MKSLLIRHSWLLLVFMCALGFFAPISTAFAKVICVLFVPTFIVLYGGELRLWWREHHAERQYFYGIWFVCVYVFLQVAIWSFLPNKYGYKPIYSAIEEFVFAYLFLSVLAWVMGVGLTQKMFERIIIAFGVCTALFGIFLLWAYYDLSQLWTAPKAFISNVLQCRFLGCGSAKFPHLFIFLKNYSFYPTLGVLLLIPFVVKYTGVKRWLLLLFSIINACLLIFTINKGTIIGLCVVLVLMATYFTKRLTWRKKTVVLSFIVAVIVIVVALMPQEVKVRFVEMVSESKAFIKEGHDSGSASTRLTIWKILLSHVKEFWLFGEGPLYATNRLRTYMIEAGYQHYLDYGHIYHNQYLTYFHAYGLVGLLFLPFLLFYPLYASLRYRKFSVTLTCVAIVFAIALMEDRYIGKDMVAVLLFILYLSFFQIDKWRAIENKTSTSDAKHLAPDSVAIATKVYPSDEKRYFSIVIPTWNNLNMLKLCVGSIVKNSRFKHQIILHINEGKDGTLEWAEKNEIAYSYTPINVGVSLAVNSAAALAQTDYILYMNDDMYACPDWDYHLWEEIKKQPDNKFFLSATSIEPRDANKHVAIAPYNFGRSPDTFKEKDLLQQYADLPMQDWSGASWPPNIVHRTIWEQVGGYSLEFFPGFYSDPDFSMKLWRAGIRRFKGVAKSRVYHFLEISTGKIKHLRVNQGRKLFLQKWGITSRIFYKHYLSMGSKNPQPLTLHKTFSFYMDKLMCIFK